jgi:hypothetical protein
MAFRLTGTEPYQVPTNADLGSMAFQDAKGVTIGTANVAQLYINGGDATNIQVLDDISAAFDGFTTAFRLSVDNFTITPVGPEQMMVSIGGMIISPFINNTDNVYMPVTSSTSFTKGYQLAANGYIVFANAPQPNMDFDGRLLNYSQTYAASRSYPFSPLTIAYHDY